MKANNRKIKWMWKRAPSSFGLSLKQWARYVVFKAIAHGDTAFHGKTETVCATWLANKGLFKGSLELSRL